MVPPPPSPPLSYSIAPHIAKYNITSAEYRATYAPVSNQFVAAIAVFHPDSASDPKLLLIQRAAADPWSANFWELPGGGTEPEENIIDAAARELWEETGLRASAITGLAGVYDRDADLTMPATAKSRPGWVKATFIGEFETGPEGFTVRVDPEEHQNYLWATEAEVQADKVGDIDIIWTFPSQKASVLQAFEAFKALKA